MADLELFEYKNDQLVLKSNVAEMLMVCDKEIKKYEKLKSSIIDKIKEVMEQNNIIKIETDEVLINYIAESYRETFDSKQLKKEDETLYNKYIKISKVKSSVRIKLKNDNLDSKE